ncbi:MAG: SpoIIE family protein phosphatase [Calditrichaeota bacterium]|nr:SpoIIE family protein phosphatase [Calditrichota bacterium]
MLRIPKNILIVFILFLSIAILFIDIFTYYSQLQIPALENLREMFILLMAFFWFLLIKKQKFSEFSLKKKLFYLAMLISANYLVATFLSIVLNPLYSRMFPPRYQSLSAIIYATLISIVAIVTLIPSFLILKELFFYKPRRRTRLYLNSFVFLLLFASIGAFIQKSSVLQFSYQPEVLAFYLALAVATPLLFHNDWLTYLPRKEKLLYFFLGGLVFVETSFLFDAAFDPHLAAYSISLATFTFGLWLVLLLYLMIAEFKLMIYLPTAKAFDRKIKEVNSLYNLARTLNTELEPERLHQLITQLTARVLESQSTWLEIYDEKAHTLKVVSHINLSPTQLANNPFHVNDGLNRILIKEGRPLLLNDLAQHREFRHILKWKRDARALIAAPLFSNRGQLMGILYATKPRPFGFDVDDVSLIEGFANQAAIALENAHLLQESIQRERLEQELKIAREVQLKLLPQTMPEVEGLQVVSYSLTAYEVGGDFYDFFQFADGNFGLVIGDVSGKGTSAAFYMAEFKGVIQTLARTLDDPLELAIRANEIIYRNMERRSFVSAVFGKYDQRRQQFQFVRAGHTPVIYCQAATAEVQFLQPSGLGIGLDSGDIFTRVTRIEQISLLPQDILFLYTDGLTEARNPHGEEFGEERLQQLLAQCRNENLHRMKEIVFDRVMDFIQNTPLHDDLTYVILKKR